MRREAKSVVPLLHPVTDPFSPDRSRGGEVQGLSNPMVPDQVRNRPSTREREIGKCPTRDNGAGGTFREFLEPLVDGGGILTASRSGEIGASVPSKSKA